MQVKTHFKIVQLSVLITPLGMHQDYRGLNLCASGSSSDNSNRKNNKIYGWHYKQLPLSHWEKKVEIWHHDIVLKHVSWKLYLTQALSRILNSMNCCREEFYKYSLSSSVWPSAAALNETVIKLSEINSKVAALNGKRRWLHVNLW